MLNLTIACVISLLLTCSAAEYDGMPPWHSCEGYDYLPSNYTPPVPSLRNSSFIRIAVRLDYNTTKSPWQPVCTVSNSTKSTTIHVMVYVEFTSNSTGPRADGDMVSYEAAADLLFRLADGTNYAILVPPLNESDSFIPFENSAGYPRPLDYGPQLCAPVYNDIWGQLNLKDLGSSPLQCFLYVNSVTGGTYCELDGQGGIDRKAWTENLVDYNFQVFTEGGSDSDTVWWPGTPSQFTRLTD